MKQSAARKAVPSSVSEDPIPTFGDVFPDGAFLDLVRNGASMRPRLLLWDGREQIVDDDVEYRGQRYEPHAIHETFLRELKLPAQVGTSGPVREFLPEICKLIDRFVSLPEKSTALVGRFILATWLVDAMQTAPRMLIEGPDTARARQLMQLLHCCCRRAVPMSAVTPAGLCSLPSGMRLTLLLQQEAISPKLAALLNGAAFAGIQFSEPANCGIYSVPKWSCATRGFGEGIWVTSSIRVPCMPTSGRLPVLNAEQQQRIAEEFQAKLLGFRLSHYRAACATSFDHLEVRLPPAAACNEPCGRHAGRR